MKKYLIILLLCLLPLLVMGAVDTWDGQEGVDTWDGQTGVDTSDGQEHANAGCETIHKNYETGGDSDTVFGAGMCDCGSAEIILGSGEGATICKVAIYIKDTAGGSNNIRVGFMGDSAGVPDGSYITNGSSDWIAASSVGSDYAWVEFTFSTNPTLSQSTTYHLVAEASTVDTNYFWRMDNNDSGIDGGYSGASDCSSDWTNRSGDGFYFRIYK